MNDLKAENDDLKQENQRLAVQNKCLHEAIKRAKRKSKVASICSLEQQKSCLCQFSKSKCKGIVAKQHTSHEEPRRKKRSCFAVSKPKAPPKPPPPQEFALSQESLFSCKQMLLCDDSHDTYTGPPIIASQPAAVSNVFSSSKSQASSGESSVVSLPTLNRCSANANVNRKRRSNITLRQMSKKRRL